MLVAFSVCKKDTEQLLDLLHWIQQLGGCHGHDAVIVADAGTPFSDMTMIQSVARVSFDNVNIITNDREVDSWIEGPKSLMIAAFKYAHKLAVPFLQMDSDAIPLRAGWLDIIAGAYDLISEEYMGCFYSCNQPGLPKLLMSPVAVYGPNSDDLIETISPAGKHWDVEMTPEVMKCAAHTPLIYHLFGEMGNPPTFGEQAIYGTNQFSLEQIPKQAVIFHRNKDGTLIDLLRQKLGLPSRKKKLKEGPMSFFQMGRIGDLVMLCPAFKRWADVTQQPVNVYTSQHFGTVLEGCSYILPRYIPLDWATQCGDALRVARHFHPDTVCVQLHGQGLHCPKDDYASYSLTMWDRCGLMHEYMDHLPVFDRRSKLREISLVHRFRKTSKPLILVNFNGFTSPLSDPKIIGALGTVADRCEIVNISETRATRIYDLLGLFDQAAGIVTLDTMSLHLAAACKTPYVAYTRDDGQAGSIPKGNCVKRVGYSKAGRDMNAVMEIVKGWIK